MKKHWRISALTIKALILLVILIIVSSSWHMAQLTAWKLKDSLSAKEVSFERFSGFPLSQEGLTLHNVVATDMSRWPGAILKIQEINLQRYYFTGADFEITNARLTMPDALTPIIFSGVYAKGQLYVDAFTNMVDFDAVKNILNLDQLKHLTGLIKDVQATLTANNNAYVINARFNVDRLVGLDYEVMDNTGSFVFWFSKKKGVWVSDGQLTLTDGYAKTSGVSVNLDTAMFHFYSAHEDPTFDIQAYKQVQKHKIMISAVGTKQVYDLDFSATPPLPNDRIKDALVMGIIPMSHQRLSAPKGEFFSIP